MVRVWGHHRILGIVKQISSVPKELTADWWKPCKESCVLISLDGPDSWLPCFVTYHLIHLKRASLVSKGSIYLYCILWVILLNIHISIYHRHFSVSIAMRTFTVIQNCHHCPFSPSEMLSSLTSISSFFCSSPKQPRFCLFWVVNHWDFLTGMAQWMTCIIVL